MINWSIDEENELIWIEILFVNMMLKKNLKRHKFE
jgi:hypothetical protein